MTIPNGSTTAPAFQLYVRDWLTDPNVLLMPPATQAAYMRLLCFYWLEGELPVEPSQLRTLVGNLTAKEWSVAWKHLEPRLPLDPDNPNRRYNRRLARQREELDAKRHARSESGKAGAKARWSQEHDNGSG